MNTNYIDIDVRAVDATFLRTLKETGHLQDVAVQHTLQYLRTRREHLNTLIALLEIERTIGHH